MPLEICKLSREKWSKICKEVYDITTEKGVALFKRCASMAINSKGMFRKLSISVY